MGLKTDIPRLEGEVENTIALYEDRPELINMTDMILNNILKLIIALRSFVLN